MIFSVNAEKLFNKIQYISFCNKKTSQITDRRKLSLSDKGYLQKNPIVDIIHDDILSMNTFP